MGLLCMIFIKNKEEKKNLSMDKRKYCFFYVCLDKL